MQGAPGSRGPAGDRGYKGDRGQPGYLVNVFSFILYKPIISFFFEGIDGLQGPKGEKGDMGASGPQVTQRGIYLNKYVFFCIHEKGKVGKQGPPGPYGSKGETG